MASDYIVSLEDKCYRANKTSLDLLQRIRDLELEVETLNQREETEDRLYGPKLETESGYTHLLCQVIIINRTLSQLIEFGQ